MQSNSQECSKLKASKLVLETIGEDTGEGPSLWLTLVMALMSWALDTKVKNGEITSFTGEITLEGAVMSVGGIKEKIMGSVASGLTQIYIPKANEKEAKRLDDETKSKISIHSVSSVFEVLPKIFPQHFKTNVLFKN